MKKILSLGVAAAVVSMTAVAASAAIEPIILEEAVAGQTITVEVRANDIAVSDIGFTVVASDNLELVDATADAAGIFNAENGKFAWASMSDCEPGALLLTLTYTVGEGEEVSVALESDIYADALGEAATATVVAGGEDLGDPDEGGDIIVDEPVEDGGEDAGDAGEDAGDAGEDAGNPDTGIALAVVPAVLAGAAIVVSKKRK